MFKFRLTFIFVFIYLCGLSQDKYMVYFTDKSQSTFDPYSYFDSKAISRRIKANISLKDSTDFPVNENYITIVSDLCIELKGTSRWFNSVVCLATNEEITAIQSLPFVKVIEQMDSKQIISTTSVDTSQVSDFFLTLHGQTQYLGLNEFQYNEYRGEGIRIAIFDVGFKEANRLDELNHVFSNNQVIKTYDFVKDKELNFEKGGTHGTMVMSCVAGIYDSIPMGLAPNSEFLLARTERLITEFGSEEENWLFAAEWADKNGVDIINSSLGYTSERYFQSDMQGNTAVVTRAANMAASKGILVVNSAGNEGDTYWKTIGAPADADSVLSVGGIEPALGYHASWSSYGPTADKRLKPNVCAYGNAIVLSPEGVSLNSGTSFSSPLVVGFAACAWQANPDYTNMELFHAIEESANLYPYFDYVHGYGIPQASYFLDYEYDIKPETEPTFTYKFEDNLLKISLIIDSAYIKLSDSLPQQETINYSDSLTNYDSNAYFSDTTDLVFIPGYNIYIIPDYLYFHVENQEGYLDSYQVILPDGINAGEIDLTNFKGKTIRIFYNDYIEEFYVE